MPTGYNSNMLTRAQVVKKNNLDKAQKLYQSEPKENEYLVVVGVKDKLNHEIMVALQLNNKDSGYEINQIASVYGRNNINNYIKNRIGKYQVYSKFEQKNTREAPARNMQYVQVVSSSSSNYNIITRDDIVNKYNLKRNQKLWQSEPKENDSVFNNFELSDIEEALKKTFIYLLVLYVH